MYSVICKYHKETQLSRYMYGYIYGYIYIYIWNWQHMMVQLVKYVFPYCIGIMFTLPHRYLTSLTIARVNNALQWYNIRAVPYRTPAKWKLFQHLAQADNKAPHHGPFANVIYRRPVDYHHTQMVSSTECALMAWRHHGETLRQNATIALFVVFNVLLSFLQFR